MACPPAVPVAGDEWGPEGQDQWAQERKSRSALLHTNTTLLTSFRFEMFLVLVLRGR